MTYNPNIPQPTDNISNSQAQLLTNFTQLKSIFAADHYTWDNPTAANRGYHVQITYPVAKTVTTLTTGTQGLLYTVNNSGLSNLTELFFANSTFFTQITSNGNAIWKGSPAGGEDGVVVTSNSTNGYMILPNGVIMQWGTKTGTASHTTTDISFNTTFTSKVYSIQCTANVSDNSTIRLTVLDGNTTTSGFTIQTTSSSSLISVYWFAIGK